MCQKGLSDGQWEGRTTNSLHTQELLNLENYGLIKNKQEQANQEKLVIIFSGARIAGFQIYAPNSISVFSKVY